MFKLENKRINDVNFIEAACYTGDRRGIHVDFFVVRWNFTHSVSKLRPLNLKYIVTPLTSLPMLNNYIWNKGLSVSDTGFITVK